jgi:IS4 transposase
MYSTKTDRTTGVITDQIGLLTVYRSHKRYPDKIWKIRYIDREKRKRFIFLTNNFSLTAADIALLYKNRWQIELFFKWLKQHLKITSFWGHSENTVKIQL